MKKLLVVVALTAILGSACSDTKVRILSRYADTYATEENVEAICERERERCISLGRRLGVAGQANPVEKYNNEDDAKKLQRADLADEYAPARIVVPNVPIQDPCLAWVEQGAYDWEYGCFQA